MGDFHWFCHGSKSCYGIVFDCCVIWSILILSCLTIEKGEEFCVALTPLVVIYIHFLLNHLWARSLAFEMHENDEIGI